jgi:hypothetical protein
MKYAVAALLGLVDAQILAPFSAEDGARRLQ